jgi:hypothetical protein
MTLGDKIGLNDLPLDHFLDPVRSGQGESRSEREVVPVLEAWRLSVFEMLSKEFSGGIVR